MKTRMERILAKLAQHHAPHLLQSAPESQDARLSFLADGLAKNGILIIAGDVPAQNYEALVGEWVGAYWSLYNNLTRVLFPSFTALDAVYADNLRPPIAVIEGQSAAVIQALGRYVAPYVALRAQEKMISDAELRGVMTFILDELEANDVANEMRTKLWQEGSTIIGSLLQMPVKHYAVTSFARPLFQSIQRNHGVNIPKQEQHAQKPPSPPELLPEEPPQMESTDSGELFKAHIPLLIKGGRKTTRKPPVPRPRTNLDEKD